MKSLVIDSQDVAQIGDELYCRTPESLELTLETLREIGYEVRDLRLDENHLRQLDTSPEEMERAGNSLWYANIAVRQGKCGSCHGHISNRGIESHGHTCELCGAITYLKLPQGARVRFRFLTSGTRSIYPQLNMSVIHWDIDDGWLYLNPEPLAYAGLGVVRGMEAQEYLTKHADKWQLVSYEGQPAIMFRFIPNMNGRDRRANVIDLHGFFGEYRNFEIVRVWDGAEYPAYGGDFPVRESFHIFELWRRADANMDLCTG